MFFIFFFMHLIFLKQFITTYKLLHLHTQTLASTILYLLRTTGIKVKSPKEKYDLRRGASFLIISYSVNFFVQELDHLYDFINLFQYELNQFLHKLKCCINIVFSLSKNELAYIIKKKKIVNFHVKIEVL